MLSTSNLKPYLTEGIGLSIICFYDSKTSMNSLSSLFVLWGATKKSEMHLIVKGCRANQGVEVGQLIRETTKCLFNQSDCGRRPPVLRC
jgi:hypothetical protein